MTNKENPVLLRMKEGTFGQLVFHDAMKFLIRREISEVIHRHDPAPQEELEACYARIEAIRANAEALMEVHRRACQDHPEGFRFAPEPDHRNFGPNTPSAPYPHGSQL